MEENRASLQTVGCGRFLGFDTTGTGNKRKDKLDIMKIF